MSVVKRAAELFALPILLVVLWWIYAVVSDSFYWPTPATIGETFVAMWSGPDFVQHALPSALRAVSGILIASALGIVLGTLLGLNARAYATFAPLLEFFRAIPPVVVVPVFVLFMGIGDAMKVAVIVFGCVWPVLLNTVDGVRSLHPVLLETSRTYQIRGFELTRRIVLPHALPQIMVGIRVSTALGLILMVVSEMFAASEGLGFLIVQAQRTFAIPEMWSGIVLLGILGFVITLAMQIIERRVLSWYHGQKEAEHAE